jgi:hypothetical protein
MVTFVLGQSLLPLDSLKIGRFIVNLDEPQADYFDPDCEPPKILVAPQLQYRMKVEDGADRSLDVSLLQLVSAARSKRKNLSSQVSADRVLTYKLDRSTDWFRDAIKLQGTRAWMEEALSQGDGVYLVVGYHTLIDAVIRENAKTVGSASLKTQLPVSEALLASSGIIIPFGIADPAVKGTVGHNKAAQVEFVAAG